MFLFIGGYELFIKIPFTKQESTGNVLSMVKTDFSESVRFIWKEKPSIGKGVLVVCAINLFLSAMITVGLPYIVTEVLDFHVSFANTLYGYAEGALAAGGIAGGICAGIFAGKLNIKKSGNILAVCSVCVFPIGITLLLSPTAMVSYLVITACCFVIMAFSTVFSVQMLSFIQTEIPPNLIGKVIAVVLTVSMCSQPLGNALYGILFEVCNGFEYVVIWFAGFVSLAIAIGTKSIFKNFAPSAQADDLVTYGTSSKTK